MQNYTNWICVQRWNKESRNHLLKVFIAVTRVSPHVPCYLYVCTCGPSGVGRPFIEVLVFSQTKSAEFRQTKHKVSGLLKRTRSEPSVGVQRSHSSLAVLILKIGKFCLKMERDACQGMPWALKQAHNIWEIDVTREGFVIGAHVHIVLFFLRTWWIELVQNWSEWHEKCNSRTLNTSLNVK